MNRIYDLNDGWEFWGDYHDEVEAFREGRPAREAGIKTESVRLPHTVKETPYNYFDESVYQTVSGYRRILYIPDTWKGKTILLHIGAAAHVAQVYMNGKWVAAHFCGYTAFTVDLTDSIQDGDPIKYGSENVICIRVDSREHNNIPPFGHVIDYMTYGGLYREVTLEVKEPDHIQDVFVIPRLSTRAKLLDRDCPESEVGERLQELTVPGTVWSELALSLSEDIENNKYKLQIRQRIWKVSENTKNTPAVADKVFDLEELKTRVRTGPEGDYQVYVTRIPLSDCEIWDIESPNRYLLLTELIQDGEYLDSSEEIFGLRRTHFAADGFYLNGRKLKLRGLNRHQSYPYVGYAMPRSMQEMDADILKHELCLNAVRTSHYPQSQHFVNRCDEIGLLVFTEIPGWQHIGDEHWKRQAVKNTQDMVLQYRNHPSIILWGVRINESPDDDAFYRRTNAAAKALDGTRATGGVRCHRKSSLLEDVYTFNDFIHSGENAGCQKKKKVTSDMDKAYLISEYNGHMFPAKMYDSEDHRLEHALRHANVLNAVAGEEDIAGSFGWCMADYNTHRDFGSGDRICYHGVLDMYRNPKPAAAVYSTFSGERPVLSVSSAMDIGEHPGGNPSDIWMFTNADRVRMYKNDRFLKEYSPSESPYRHLPHPPMPVDEFVGDAMKENENYSPAQEREIRELLNYAARYGFDGFPPAIKAKALHLMTRYRMTFEDANELYGKYVGDWGGSATTYRFEAVRDGKAEAVVTKSPVTSLHMYVQVSHTMLKEGPTYDVAAVRIRMQDQNGNDLPFYQGCVRLSLTGPAEVIGPDIVTLRGGCGGTYIKTTGEAGQVILTLMNDQTQEEQVYFSVVRDNLNSRRGWRA